MFRRHGAASPDGRIPPLATLALGPRDVPGFSLRIDRAHAPEKLPRDATDGIVRTWARGREVIALTIDRFTTPRAAVKGVRRDEREARGVTGRIDVPGIPGVVGFTARKAGAMPDDGSEACMAAVAFPAGALGVFITHMGPVAPDPGLVQRLAADQARRLAEIVPGGS